MSRSSGTICRWLWVEELEVDDRVAAVEARRL